MNSKMTNMGSMSPVSGFGRQVTLESLLVPCGEIARQENHVCLQHPGPEMGHLLSGQTLTLGGPGHQLSSVDLERVIGKDRDQDDAKYLWERNAGGIAEAVRIGE